MKSLASVCLAAVAAAGCSTSSPVQPTSGAAAGRSEIVIPAPSEQEGGRPIIVTLTGAAERPGPGDPDGTGTATFSLNLGQNQICWEITWANIDTPTAAHIHEAPSTSPGPVRVPLSPIASGCSESVSRDRIRDILQNPENYYVNVHNATYTGGAIRAQLTK